MTRKCIVAILFVVLAASLILTVDGSKASSENEELLENQKDKSSIQSTGKVKAEIGTYLKKLTLQQGFSGAVLIAKGKKILFKKGYGWTDRKKTSPVKSSTKFYIASISKQFTASAILKLQEQQKLNVQDPISKYLKDVPLDKKGITLHQLLTHTAGLKEMYAADGINDRDEAVRLLLKEPLKSKPGEKFGYTNDAYNLLAIVVEIVSGQPYELFLREQLLKPAKMSQTGFWGESLVAGEKPIAEMLHDVPVESKLPNWGFRGATGMFSTAEDLYKWQQALFGDRVLSKTAEEKLLTPYAQTSRGTYTYGWFISDEEKIGKEIWTAGNEDFRHNAIIKTYPDGTVIIVVSNAGKISGGLARDVVSKGLESILFNRTT